MENETLFAQRLAQCLNQSLDDLPQHVQARLSLARDAALAKLPAKRPVLVSVGRGVLGLDFGFFKRRAAFATLVAAIAISALGTLQYNNAQDSATAAADLDEEILSDDAPVQAYMDPAFTAVFHSGLLSKNADK